MKFRINPENCHPCSTQGVLGNSRGLELQCLLKVKDDLSIDFSG